MHRTAVKTCDVPPPPLTVTCLQPQGQRHANTETQRHESVFHEKDMWFSHQSISHKPCSSGVECNNRLKKLNKKYGKPHYIPFTWNNLSGTSFPQDKTESRASNKMLNRLCCKYVYVVVKVERQGPQPATDVRRGKIKIFLAVTVLTAQFPLFFLHWGNAPLTTSSFCGRHKLLFSSTSVATLDVGALSSPMCSKAAPLQC